jgi:predicted component of type VI protein secretion system
MACALHHAVSVVRHIVNDMSVPVCVCGLCRAVPGCLWTAWARAAAAAAQHVYGDRCKGQQQQQQQQAQLSSE